MKISPIVLSSASIALFPYLISSLLACQHKYEIAHIIAPHIGQSLWELCRSDDAFNPPTHEVHGSCKVFDWDYLEPIAYFQSLWNNRKSLVGIGFSTIIDRSCKESFLMRLHALVWINWFRRQFGSIEYWIEQYNVLGTIHFKGV